MKYIFILLLLFLSGTAISQQVDTVIITKYYTSYFNYTLHEPLYVAYKLYHGGGSFSRKGMRFKTGWVKNSAIAADYSHTGYDEGHLANAEDFAFDSTAEESTFRFYNCQPQTARLNRGIWKTWETNIRKESQQDSLLVLCGGIFSNKKIGAAAVPDYCWKVVISLSTGQVMHCFIFPNDNSDTVESITVDALKDKLGYNLKY